MHTFATLNVNVSQWVRLIPWQRETDLEQQTERGETEGKMASVIVKPVSQTQAEAEKRQLRVQYHDTQSQEQSVCVWGRRSSLLPTSTLNCTSHTHFQSKSVGGLIMIYVDISSHSFLLTTGNPNGSHFPPLIWTAKPRRAFYFRSSASLVFSWIYKFLNQPLFFKDINPFWSCSDAKTLVCTKEQSCVNHSQKSRQVWWASAPSPSDIHRHTCYQWVVMRQMGHCCNALFKWGLMCPEKMSEVSQPIQISFLK